MKACPRCNRSLPDENEACPHGHRFRFHNATGGIRIGDVIILAVIAGAAWFVDWNSITDKLSSEAGGAPKVALTRLDCEVKGGERGPQGQVAPSYALVAGSVENLVEEPLSLSVRIDYVWKSRKFMGKRIQSVNPNPLPFNEMGWFEFKEYIDGFPGETRCMVQFFENGDKEPIPLEDRTS
jgi:hypothetical protein